MPSKKDKWQREIPSHPLSEGHWKKSHLTVRSWELKSTNVGTFPPVEGFRNHVATDGSLLGVSGKRSACGWSVVQLGHDEEMGPRHGMYGTLDAELGVQRTIKRAELTAFLVSLLESYRSHDGAR